MVTMVVMLLLFVGVQRRSPVGVSIDESVQLLDVVLSLDLNPFDLQLLLKLLKHFIIISIANLLS